MAEYVPTELEKSYEERCREILNFCLREENNFKEIRNTDIEGSSTFDSSSNSFLGYDCNVPAIQQSPQQQAHSGSNLYGNLIAPADLKSLNDNIFNSEAYKPGQNTGFNQNQNSQTGGPVLTENKFNGPHIYSTGTGFDASSSSTSNYTIGNFGKNFGKKSNFRKFNKYMPSKKEETSDLDVTPDMLGITDMSKLKSNFLVIVSLFRRLSIYAMEMCTERMSLENVISGYKSVKNYYLPTVISNISSHIKTVRQSLGYEFFEIWKLIDSIVGIDFHKDYERTVREEFQKSLNDLGEFENIKIRQKNGEILLSNDKVKHLEQVLRNLIDCVRYYSIYMRVVQFKFNKLKNSKCDLNSESVMVNERTNDDETEKRPKNLRTPGF